MDVSSRLLPSPSSLNCPLSALPPSLLGVARASERHPYERAVRLASAALVTTPAALRGFVQLVRDAMVPAAGSSCIVAGCSPLLLALHSIASKCLRETLNNER